MKTLGLFITAALILSLSSCAVVGGIFKAGVGVGIFVVVAIVAVVVFLIAKASGGSK